MTKHPQLNGHDSLDRAKSPLVLASEAIAYRNVQLRTFLLRLLDPDDLGHSVTPEVRRLVNELLLPPCIPKAQDALSQELPLNRS